MPKVEQVHHNLRHLLLNGRILLNGNPLTCTELSELLRDEQLLFNLAMEAQESKQAAKLPEKKKAEGDK